MMLLKITKAMCLILKRNAFWTIVAGLLVPGLWFLFLLSASGDVINGSFRLMCERLRYMFWSLLKVQIYSDPQQLNWADLNRLTWCVITWVEVFDVSNQFWYFASCRAVANYLQVLFEKESDQSKKVVSLDNLLVGKTRKEASRMFFETLVREISYYLIRINILCVSLSEASFQNNCPFPFQILLWIQSLQASCEVFSSNKCYFTELIWEKGLVDLAISEKGGLYYQIVVLPIPFYEIV